MPETHQHALLTVAGMSRADALAVKQGVPSLDLMEVAGSSVAREIRQRWATQPVSVLCGPGNNGGDGFVIARILADAGWPVRVSLLGPPERLKGDAAANADRWTDNISPLNIQALDDATLVVDAIFGAGLARPLEGQAKEVIAAVNDRNLTCIGVDTPSGVDGDTGEIKDIAANCALTVTFFRKKPGHLLLPGKDVCGHTVVTDIGIPPQVLEEISPTAWENDPELWRDQFPVASSDDHKYRRGHAVILGSADMTGAARLAARGARRVGAGMLSIAVPSDAVSIYSAGEPGNLIFALDQPNQLSAFLTEKRRNAALLGPGAGISQQTRRLTIESLRTGIATVLDADALSAFADDPEVLFDRISGPCVMTPHDGEFARLFDPSGDKLERVRNAAARSGAVVLLKGGDTVIAHPDGRAVINANAPPELATAGAGDVLAGIIVGLLAQGMDAFEAACAGAWLHGAAAANFGVGLIAEDLPEQLPMVLKRLK